MSRPRVYVSEPLAAGTRIDLEPRAARHVSRVLRLREGDALIVFDGRGGEHRAWVASVRRGEVAVAVEAYVAVDRESPLAVELVQGISRGERMDYTVRKAVELGVAAVHPVVTARTVVRLDPGRAASRLAHWQGIVVAACEQSGRTRVPEVHPVVPLDRWLADLPPGATRVVLDAAAGRALRDVEPPAAAVVLLVGPEGGLAADERARVVAAGFEPLHLGPRVLRTETAGVAALTAFQVLWGDLGLG